MGTRARRAALNGWARNKATAATQELQMLEALQSLDWQTMFFGDAPPIFLVEIVVRTFTIYAYSLLLIRWIGGRGIAQMSVVEFLLVVALGSAVGDAMFYPDVPLVHAMLVITIVVVINKLIDIGMMISPQIRRVFTGQTVMLVDHGRIDLCALRYLKLSREELFEGLRDRGIRNLGRVERAFLETGGHFSVFQRKGPVIGMNIVPPLADGSTEAAGDRICADCGGSLVKGIETCPYCGGDLFVQATADLDDST
jgi:uncharacterized membrane protein YcaP (DUF421 family)